MGLFTVNAPAAKFAKVGDSVSGEIIDVYQSQRYEFVRNGNGQPLYWSNRKPTPGARIDPVTGKKNDPVLQYVITVDTGVADEDGNTERRIFVKNKRMEDALKRAVRDSKAREGLLLGGQLSCEYTGDDETSDAPQAPKMYAFTYAPPAAGEGRQPSGEVRLADREDYAEEPPTSYSATAPAPRDAELVGAGATQELIGSHKSSPVIKRALGIKDDDEPPF